MAYTPESGHAKNVSNFEFLIVCLTNLGANYYSNNIRLQIPQLELLLERARATLSNTVDKLADYRVAVNNKQNIFKGLKKLSTRIMASLRSAEANKFLIEDAEFYNRKIQGKRAKTQSKAAATIDLLQPIQKSVSQQSAVQLVQHFYGLLSIVKKAIVYNPTAPELSIPNLIAFMADLQTKIKAVTIAESELYDARTNRDNTLYIAPDSLVNIALTIKEEIKSIFGTTSPYYIMIRHISFRKNIY